MKFPITFLVILTAASTASAQTTGSGAAGGSPGVGATGAGAGGGAGVAAPQTPATAVPTLPTTPDSSISRVPGANLPATSTIPPGTPAVPPGLGTADRRARGIPGTSPFAGDLPPGRPFLTNLPAGATNSAGLPSTNFFTRRPAGFTNLPAGRPFLTNPAALPGRAFGTNLPPGLTNTVPGQRSALPQLNQEQHAAVQRLINDLALVRATPTALADLTTRFVQTLNASVSGNPRPPGEAVVQLGAELATAWRTHRMPLGMQRQMLADLYLLLNSGGADPVLRDQTYADLRQLLGASGMDPASVQRLNDQLSQLLATMQQSTAVGLANPGATVPAR